MIRGAEFLKQASPKHPGTEKQLEQHWGCASYTGVPALYIPASLKPGFSQREDPWVKSAFS